MNTRLLACPDADDGPAVCVGNAVRLCVLQRESGDNEVRESLVGKLEDCYEYYSWIGVVCMWPTSLFFVTMLVNRLASILASLRLC